MTGSLQYMCASKPDIYFFVHGCAHFQANIKLNHLIDIRQVIKYISGTINYRLWYTKYTSCEISFFY